MNRYKVKYTFDCFVEGKLNHDGFGVTFVNAADEYDARRIIIRHLSKTQQSSNGLNESYFNFKIISVELR